VRPGKQTPKAPRPRVPSVRLGARRDGGAPQPSFRFCLDAIAAGNPVAPFPALPVIVQSDTAPRGAI
jgi:hypothetical protein